MVDRYSLVAVLSLSSLLLQEFLENEQYNSDEELPQKLGEYKSE